jgi:ABC-2 type transport system ATP-binding protein
MIKIKDLVKKYGNFTAVNKISLTVNAGEVFGFLGVNGAGKTSTLRILSGINKATSGEVNLGGFDLFRDPESAKQIVGYISDRPYLYGKLRAGELLEFIAELYQIPLRISRPRAKELLAEYSLTKYSEQLVESFSHGMKQRLATCVALIHQPKILIIDEPMVGLDPHGAAHFKQLLRNYASNGMAVFLSTHSLNVAEVVCDRLAIIHKGQIIAEGTLAEMKGKAKLERADLEQVFLQITSEQEQ